MKHRSSRSSPSPLAMALACCWCLPSTQGPRSPRRPLKTCLSPSPLRKTSPSRPLRKTSSCPPSLHEIYPSPPILLTSLGSPRPLHGLCSVELTTWGWSSSGALSLTRCAPLPTDSTVAGAPPATRPAVGRRDARSLAHPIVRRGKPLHRRTRPGLRAAICGASLPLCCLAPQAVAASSLPASSRPTWMWRWWRSRRGGRWSSSSTTGGAFDHFARLPTLPALAGSDVTPDIIR